MPRSKDNTKLLTQSPNVETARRYLNAIERGATGDTLAEFFTPNVVQEEFPNRLMTHGARRDLAALLEGAERGQKVISAQRYEIRNEVASGNFIALEVLWTGTLAIPIGSLAVGDNMRAHFAVFLEFRDGKIVAQRNYDCFDPW
jgi:ketosteroid isomerase-like protein